MRIDNNLNVNSIFKFNSSENVSEDYKNFGDIFKTTLNILDETNQVDAYAQKLQVDYVTGENDDIIALNMAQSRANFAVQFAAQVTNKIVSAYREIMSISI